MTRIGKIIIPTLVFASLGVNVYGLRKINLQ